MLDEVGALRAWPQERRADGSDYLFTSQKGGRLDARNSFVSSGPAPRRPGCRLRSAIPMHSRHTLASHLVAANVNLALVRQCLGHKTIGSTMQYVGVSDGQAAEAAQKAMMQLY